MPHCSLQIGRTKYGNTCPIEKRLFLRKDKNRQRLADIANIAMTGFAANPDYPFRPSDGRIPRRAKKNALQPLFKALASLLKEPFFNPAREDKQDTKFKTGRKTFPNLTSFFWGRRKKFQNSNPGANSAPKPLNSGNLPLFPGIFRILSHHSNAAARKRRQKTPAPRKRGGSRICAPEKSLKNRG